MVLDKLWEVVQFECLCDKRAKKGWRELRVVKYRKGKGGCDGGLKALAKNG